MRLAVTDRCNMSCDCIRAIGNEWLSKEQLLSNEEMLRLYSVLVKMGIVLDEEMVAHVIIKQAIKNNDHTLA
ncbi:MAG TPA: hypothetical protein VJ499_10090, partial [Flavisolibacter sp.]|nr:hypothetical protein [Flavisolibacter sp.]